MESINQESRFWGLSSTCRGIIAGGKSQGKLAALSETGAYALSRILAYQAKKKFGLEDRDGVAILDALSAARSIDHMTQLGDSLLVATDWKGWLAGVTPPPPTRDDFPEYARDDNINLEPELPYIEKTAKMPTIAGKEMIFQLRLQKWYQPDIGEVLYKEACKIEEKFKATPLIGLVLLAPSADGPMVTGRYRGTDKSGRKIDFHYKVQRVWEIPAEEALANPATMNFVPLAKGAKGRMPELMKQMRANAQTKKMDPEKLETIWVMVYWAIGMINTQEESDEIFGDLLPVVKNSKYYKKVYGHAFQRGYAGALADGSMIAVRELVARQAKKRFGDDPTNLLVLEAIGSFEKLKAIAGRIPTASSWSELLSE